MKNMLSLDRKALDILRLNLWFLATSFISAGWLRLAPPQDLVYRLVQLARLQGLMLLLAQSYSLMRPLVRSLRPLLPTLFALPMLRPPMAFLRMRPLMGIPALDTPTPRAKSSSSYQRPPAAKGFWSDGEWFPSIRAWQKKKWSKEA